jgi:lipoprotein-releasing system ATP-binding protein
MKTMAHKIQLKSSDTDIVLQGNNIGKIFSDGKLYVEVLRGINLKVFKGEMLAIVGPSGSGKSTLMHILGGLDLPTSGSVNICGVDINKLSEKEKGLLRNKYLGFVYQFHHLLPEFTALENVSMPLLIAGIKPKIAAEKARDILAKVGLGNRVQHRTSELSGGERQRVAIARALVNEPKCVLADEPTGNLDHNTAENIYELISTLNNELQTAFVIVTHDLNIAKRMDRILTIRDGLIQK